MKWQDFTMLEMDQLHDYQTFNELGKGVNCLMVIKETHHSGFAWVITNNEDAHWRGVGLTPGNAKDMHSGHAEAFGMLAALIFLKHYIQSYGPNRFEDTLICCFCDNIRVTTMLTNMQNATITCPNDTTDDNCDIYLAISENITQCAPITLQFLHVMGHQDIKLNRPLTITKQWNIECDKKAKLYVTNMKIKSTSFSNPAIPAAQPHLIINGKLLYQKLLPTRQQSLSTPDYYCNLQQKLDCAPGNVAIIHCSMPIHGLLQPTRPMPPGPLHQQQLPLRASKAHPHHGLPLCPSCRCEPKDHWHFMECLHPA